ncbi:hypothetical protein [Rhodohalobacter sp.]|uniref:hypothetical protein n=1 Tax=Rhodohalobacter sp. TaxID=1974210 RepID=UPI0035681AE7
MNNLSRILTLTFLIFTQNALGQNLIDSSLTETEYLNITEELKVFSDFENVGGAIIYRDDNRTLSLGHLKKDSLHVILLEKINVGKRPTKQMLDTLNFISYSENNWTNLNMCTDIDNPDRKGIFGFYNREKGKDYTNKKYFDNIVFAWQVDLNNSRMELINPDRIKCVNIGYGV